MICYFIDYKTYKKGEEKLAKLSLLHKNAKFLDPKLGISLITCHRIEYYIRDDAQIQDRKFLKNFNMIDDQSKIYERLFCIALGLHSKIIGESSIFKQVSICINDYLYNNPQDKTYINILLNAQKIRDDFKFFAKNHGQLIYDNIRNSKSETIIFFGAGLLNQTIIDSIEYPTDYKNIILITKNVSKARKYLSNKRDLKILEIDYLNSNIPTTFDIFVATDQLNANTAKAIINLSKKKNCLNFVDVSSYPILRPKKMDKYFSLYSKNTSKLIKESNSEIKFKWLKILRLLESKRNYWYIN